MTHSSDKTASGQARPILFSAPMVRALIAGTKTQTRRILKPQPPSDSGKLAWTAYHPTKVDRHGEEYAGPVTLGASSEDGSFVAPVRIVPGDRLWVREAWRVSASHDERKPLALPVRRCTVLFEAGGSISNSDSNRWEPDEWPRLGEQCSIKRGRLRASMHMPRWASRLTLTVTDVRVQRLQDISRDDAIAEGLMVMTDHPETLGMPWYRGHPYEPWTPEPPLAYRALWNRINGEGAWEANPWVVIYDFRVHSSNIDQMEASRERAD